MPIVETLSITREMIPIADDEWEHYPYFVRIFHFALGTMTTREDLPAPGYAKGLLRCFINDVGVNPVDFDEALARLNVGMTRGEILKKTQPRGI